MSKRYAIVNQNGEVINAIVWDGVTQIGNKVLSVDGTEYNTEEVVFVEDPYACPKDLIIDGKVYRLCCPNYHSVDITKAKKIDKNGNIKSPEHSDLVVFYAKPKVPELSEVNDKISEKINAVREPNAI